VVVGTDHSLECEFLVALGLLGASTIGGIRSVGTAGVTIAVAVVAATIAVVATAIELLPPSAFVLSLVGGATGSFFCWCSVY
jgi:hypothetical protein